MATVIKAIGAVFKNSLIIPTNLVEDGLVAAYRPNNTANGLKDLSGNGNNLIAMGSPELTSKEMVGDMDNGYDTGLKETTSLTYLVVHKTTPTNGNYSGFIIGCYNTTSDTGTSLLIDSLGINSLTGQTYFNVGAGNTRSLLLADTAAADVYRFTAVVVDAVKNEFRVVIPKLGVNLVSTPSAGAVAGRTISPTTNVELTSSRSDVEPWVGRHHIAEALIYNKGLTNAQIYEQYEISKIYMASQGITI